MKVLLAGATGHIGSHVLEQLLNHPSINSVITLSRRALPEAISANPKLQNVIVSDWIHYSDDVLDAIKDADAGVWALGTSNMNEDANYNFPIAFQNAVIAQRRKKKAIRFRLVYISGALVEPDQTRPLWFLPGPRKLRGRCEVETMRLAKDNSDVIHTIVVRPGGVLFGQPLSMSVQRAVLGTNLAISGQELGAFATDVIVKGRDEDGIVLNKEMVEKGRELLKESKI